MTKQEKLSSIQEAIDDEDSFDLHADIVQEALEAYKKELSQEENKNHKPFCYTHWFIYETGETGDYRFSFSAESPFGRPGIDHDAAFKVMTVALYSKPLEISFIEGLPEALAAIRPLYDKSMFKLDRDLKNFSGMNINKPKKTASDIIFEAASAYAEQSKTS